MATMEEPLQSDSLAQDSFGSDDSDTTAMSGPGLPLSRYQTLLEVPGGSSTTDDSDFASGPMVGRHNSDLQYQPLYGSPTSMPSQIPAQPLGPYGSPELAHGFQTPGTPRARMPNSAGVNSADMVNPHPSARAQRPVVTRTPSSAYAPARRPTQFQLPPSIRTRSSSNSRMRPNPEAEYRAQKKAYVQRIQQENFADIGISPEDYPPSLGYSSESEHDDESPTADYQDSDAYDQDVLLYYGNDDNMPSTEELKIPANRERLEWHSMLANVLTGEVVKQEKKRILGGIGLQENEAFKLELWTGIRARICGRSIPMQKSMLEEQRAKVPPIIEDIMFFEIRGEAEVGKSAQEQVEEAVRKIEKIESLYQSRKAMELAHPRMTSEAFRASSDAFIAWHNITSLISTELSVLQDWVGNEELDFTKARDRTNDQDKLLDESSFVDRILKEDGLKPLQHENNLLMGLERVILKAKATLIEHAQIFAHKHLPPYFEELLTLINFPCRLIQDIMRVRLSFTNKPKDHKPKDQSQQEPLMAEQMISQFQSLLTLAVRIKTSYLHIAQPEPGWDLPPCIDENFDSVCMEALRYYFKLLNGRLSANRNTFREAEILEQEFGFSPGLAKFFERGDVEVAEQFSTMTSKSLQRLTMNFERELQRRPNEIAGPEMDKRYKQILDSVRVRQRKLFRFSRQLTQMYENSAEYAMKMSPGFVQDFCENLIATRHVMIQTASEANDKKVFIASHSLDGRPGKIVSILTSAYLVEEPDKSWPYVLTINSESPIVWNGPRMQIDIQDSIVDVKPGKIRLIAEGALNVLQNAKDSFVQFAASDLDLIVPQRANIRSVDKELQRIKRTAYKLSNTIMDSVEIIRKQLDGLECQELIQMCFAFATEFGQRSVLYMDTNRKALNNIKLTHLALDWVSFICDDCVAVERKTFRWAVVALEFAMMMTRGQNILSISDDEYSRLRSKVASCMSLLISHFDIMGARSTMAAKAEKERIIQNVGNKFKIDVSGVKEDEESEALIRQHWAQKLQAMDDERLQRHSDHQAYGKVLEDSSEADRSLTSLSATATNVTMRWQQGNFIGGGTFGSVYAAINLESNTIMAVKEIRMQDPQLIPNIVTQIRDEMQILQYLDHPNVVTYYGIEVHRDKVYIFMEYCSGGSLSGLLEHGRIEDETVILVYALQLLEGLAYLHESSVVHRDIKPENILLDHNGVLKYVDFGAAKIIARQSTMHRPSGVVGNGANGTTSDDNAPQRQGQGQGQGRGRQPSMTGTPMYMSPEVIRGTGGITGRNGSTGGNAGSGSKDNSGARASAVDIWSLGCVILEMSTGRRPWAHLDNEWAIMYNIAQGNAPQLPNPDELSDLGRDFLTRCFERDPARRPTAAELLQHDWIMRIRNEISLHPTPQTPASETGSATTPGSNSSGGAPNSAGPATA